MDLPDLVLPVPDEELAVTLARAAHVLEIEGRRAMSGGVLSAGGRMRTTARLLRASADALLQSDGHGRTRDHPTFAEARYSLGALAGFVTWEKDRLQSYWSAFGVLQSTEVAAQTPWPKIRVRPARTARRGRTLLPLPIPDVAKTVRERRRFLVKEVFYAMMSAGTEWAVGCTTKERAIKSFERRVARNILAEDRPGAVMAYDRKTRKVFCWTDEITDPVGAAKYWFR